MSTLPFSLPSFAIEQVAVSKTGLTISACATSSTAPCPSCQQLSHRVHSYYSRRPQDLPISGHRVQLTLRVGRFRCQNRYCQRRTFAERLPELAVSARQTTRLSKLLDCIAVVLSGQAGSRLSEQLAMPVGADTHLATSQKEGSVATDTPNPWDR